MNHVYLRELDPSANDSLAKIASLIPAASRVLDVGTGSGALGRFLQTQQCVVDGLTYSSAEAELAKPAYSSLHVLDLEQTLPSSVFGDLQYDIIVCADVLEHVRNAAFVLADLRELLAANGRILISIPNATFMGVIYGLMGNRFVRTSEGLLDITHVQFFDRQGLVNLIDAAGLKVLECRDVLKGLEDSEFAALDTLALPTSMRSYIESLPDAGTYQFVWALGRNDNVPTGTLEADIPSIPRFQIQARFAAQFFCDLGDGFNEADSYFAWGKLDEEPQILKFQALQLAGARRIRIDFSDRPGVFEFFGFRLLDATGDCLWEWNGDWASDITMNDCEWPPAQGTYGGRLVRAVGPDPWVSFCTSSNLWDKATRAELKLTAPQPYSDAAFSWSTYRYQQIVLGLTSEVQALSSELREEQERRHHMELRCVEISRELRDLYASTSWRITSCLRRLGRVVSSKPGI